MITFNASSFIPELIIRTLTFLRACVVNLSSFTSFTWESIRWVITICRTLRTMSSIQVWSLWRTIHTTSYNWVVQLMGWALFTLWIWQIEIFWEITRYAWVSIEVWQVLWTFTDTGCSIVHFVLWASLTFFQSHIEKLIWRTRQTMSSIGNWLSWRTFHTRWRWLIVNLILWTR